ncbi:hypothetical protein J437_LFUL000399 [Ladona fulva]|uniref:RGS domain-containing protein n=1 Tax=Ladona fulva TaxID=123851 RepID=A0A8K0NZ39_LADFU|nr:hypothetical protein J437_LFUL000399 [Ladona fulva]
MLISHPVAFHSTAYFSRLTFADALVYRPETPTDRKVEVSLDSRVRELVNRNMKSPTPHTFDEAQLQIYTLMHRDSYPRFVNSQLFKKLAQVTNNGGGSGSSAGGAVAGTPTSTGGGRKESNA